MKKNPGYVYPMIQEPGLSEPLDARRYQVAQRLHVIKQYGSSERRTYEVCTPQLLDLHDELVERSQDIQGEFISSEIDGETEYVAKRLRDEIKTTREGEQ